MKFHQYVQMREAVDLNDIRAMILRALGANPDSQHAFNAPLSQFVEPADLSKRLNSLTGLADLINASPPAIDAIQNASQTNLTVGQLASLLTRPGQ